MLDRRHNIFDNAVITWPGEKSCSFRKQTLFLHNHVPNGHPITSASKGQPTSPAKSRGSVSCMPCVLSSATYLHPNVHQVLKNWYLIPSKPVGISNNLWQQRSIRPLSDRFRLCISEILIDVQEVETGSYLYQPVINANHLGMGLSRVFANSCPWSNTSYLKVLEEIIPCLKRWCVRRITLIGGMSDNRNFTRCDT